MIYALRGGGAVQADNADDLLRKLNDQSIFGRKKDLLKYMESVAMGCKVESNATIRTDSAENFVNDLVKEKYIIEIDENNICPPRSEFRQ